MHAAQSFRFLLLLPLLLVLVAHDPASADDKRSDDKQVVETATQKLRRLRLERIATLKRAVEFATAAYRNGEFEWDRLNAAQRALLDAQLEMATTQAERVKLIAAQLQIAQVALTFAEGRHRAGLATQLEVLEAKSRALTLEIELTKLQRKVVPRNGR